MRFRKGTTLSLACLMVGIVSLAACSSQDSVLAPAQGADFTNVDVQASSVECMPFEDACEVLGALVDEMCPNTDKNNRSMRSCRVEAFNLVYETYELCFSGDDRVKLRECAVDWQPSPDIEIPEEPGSSSSATGSKKKLPRSN